MSQAVAMDGTSCVTCGARISGLVCEFCGSLSVTDADIATAKRALDELHALVHRADKKKQSNLLKTGFIPRDKTLLIDAGVRCLPLLDESDTTSDVSLAALGRLEAIMTKLRLLPPGEEIQRAFAEFEPKIRRFRKADRLISVVAVMLVLAVVGGVVWFIASVAC